MTDAKPLAGIRILEVAAWTFVPAAGAVLAEWGADVIKVEPREGGDPQRGLVTMGLIPGGPTAVNYMIEMPNRGKKSIGIDLTTPGGQEVVHELAKTSDVFLTSYLPESARTFRHRGRADPRRQPRHHLRSRIRLRAQRVPTLTGPAMTACPSGHAAGSPMR